MYEKVIEAFDDTLNDEVFDSASFHLALTALKESKSYLKFLIGEPGTGKSFLLKHYKPDDAVFISKPITKEDLDNLMFDENPYIIIDEAQLLDKNTIEYIRILTDSKKYTFLLSMHLKEAKEILNKEHFKSRNIDVIQLSPIKKEEMIQYINKKLINNNANHLFTKKEFNTIYKYTNGNFRYIKKFIKTLFELLEFAHQNNLSKYKKINSCLITMTALKLGLEND